MPAKPIMFIVSKKQTTRHKTI